MRSIAMDNKTILTKKKKPQISQDWSGFQKSQFNRVLSEINLIVSKCVSVYT